MTKTETNKSEPKQGFAHFQIDGEDFTRLVRDRVLDGSPDGAWRLAMCLNNDTGDDREDGVANVALGILKGTKKLVGNEKGMKLVKEHKKVTEKYLQQVAFIYAGRIRIRDKWYRPIAYVTNCGRNDMRNDHGRPVYRLTNNTGYANRAWHYAGPDEIVAEHAGYPDPDHPSIKREVIFRACGDRPHWLDVPINDQAAVDEFLAAGHFLEERSHVLTYGNETPSDEETPVNRERLIARGERIAREQKALKEGDLTPMNARLNAELELARELDEDDRPIVQALRSDNFPFKKRVGHPRPVCSEGPEEGPDTLASIAKRVASLRDDLYLAKEIDDEDEREFAEEQIEREIEALRVRKLAVLRETILQQANGDLLDLSWEAVMKEGVLTGEEIRIPAGSIKVPRAPFLHWAFARMKMFESQLPPWNCVCSSGMKMPMDDPFHTDWVVGGGLDPQNRELLYYPGPVCEASLKLAHELQDKFDAPSDIHVLVDGDVVGGSIHHGKKKKPCPDGAIVVLPNLHPDYVATIEDAAAVITEEGGMTAHLAQVGRERALPIVRIANACERFQEGDMVVVNTAARTVMGV